VDRAKPAISGVAETKTLLMPRPWYPLLPGVREQIVHGLFTWVQVVGVQPAVLAAMECRELKKVQECSAGVDEFGTVRMCGDRHAGRRSGRNSTAGAVY